MSARPLLVVFVAVLATLLAPSAAVPVVQHDRDVVEFDLRTGKLPPTSAQRAAAKRMRAAVTWNRLGTPASLSKRGKFLATGIRGRNATAAARAWLNANKRVLGLRSTAGLVLEADSRLSASRGHAVSFRQVFDGVEAAEGGLVTVGLTGSAARRWKVAYVSSSLSRETSLVPGAVELSPAQAWARAARASGESFTTADVEATKRSGEYRSLRVDGLESLQQVRLVAFPTPRLGVLPAYESLVVDKAASTGERVYVDARDGRILARFNLALNLAEAEQVAPVTVPFSGTLPTTANSCAPRTVRSRSAPAFASCACSRTPTTRARTFSCRLYRDTTLVATSLDVGFTPEAIQYAAGRRRSGGQLLRRRLRLRHAARASDLQRHVHHRRLTGTSSVPRALAGLPGEPTARPAPGLTRGGTRAPTRVSCGAGTR